MKKSRFALVLISFLFVFIFSVNAQNVGKYELSNNYYLFSTSNGNTNALKSAKNYLSFMAFSYSGLIKQLEFEKYTYEEAVYAADNCGANWNEQAAKSAKNYLSLMSFSRDGLIKQLEFEGFTHEQATYGVNAAMGVNGQDNNLNGNSIGKQNALKSAKNYLSLMSFSYSGLIKQLEFEKYTHEEAVYAADNCGADWNEQAVKKAQNYLSLMSFSRDGLIKQLEFEGFTYNQAVYGASKAGY